MKFLSKVAVAVSLVAFFACNASAQQDTQNAPNTSGQINTQSGNYLQPGNYTQPGNYPQASPNATDQINQQMGNFQQNVPNTSDQMNQQIQKYLQMRRSQGMPGVGGALSNISGITVPGQIAKPGKIVVIDNPGDGLVNLSWRATEMRPNAGDQPMNYTIFYGTAPGRLIFKVDAGTSTDYVLRGLQNNQDYYVRVQGMSGDELSGTAVTVLSDEMKVTPLATADQPSPLEKSFAGKNVTLQDNTGTAPLNRSLKQFGYDFFRNSSAMAVATDNLPVGNDFVIGPGDTLQIDLWGSMQGRYQLEVDRSGQVAVPGAGVVNVSGLKFNQAKEAIDKALGRYYKGYQFNLTLGKMKTIQVFVVGEVENPGVYPVSSMSTVINALAAAGGPTRNGSLRTVKVRHNGGAAEDLDLYDIFLTGDRSKDLRLSNGDTVFVPVIGPVVAVAGEVKRPAIYELNGSTTLSKVLAMAGGVTATGYTGRIQVERIIGNRTRVILDYHPEKPSQNPDDIAIADHDMVKVFPVNGALRHMVSLDGNVVRPGEYQFRPGMKVTDILPDYDSLLPETYMEAAEIRRLHFPDMQKEILSFNLGKALSGDEKENIALREQDEIHVFSRWDMESKPVVSINGQVENPGTYDYYPNMTVRDLIASAGSLKRNAFMDSAELTRIVMDKGVARSERVNVNLRKVLEGDPGQNLVLQRDDALIVRGVEDWLDATDRFVVLKGEVRFPGTYSISKGEKLSSVIARAGGFTDKAYLKGAKFTRKSVQEEQQKRMDEVIAKSEEEIQRKQAELASLSASKEELEATQAALAGLMKSVEKLKQAKAEGRIVIHLARVDELKKSPYDLELMGGDALEVPQVSKVVHVLGQVYNPTTFVRMPDENIAYYLKKAGGPTRDAEEDDMYLIRADGTVISRQQSSFGIHWDDESRKWTFGSFMSTMPDPGDTLVVPQQLERIAWMREIKDIASILGNIALTAGVVVAAGL